MELDQIFASLIPLQTLSLFESVKIALKSYTPSDEEFKNYLVKHDFHGNEERAKYMLEVFEYNLIDDQGEYSINSGNEVHLEHIIPKTINTKKAITEFGDWPTYLGKDYVQSHRDLNNTIGNLTLLGQALNIAASNNPFEAKKKEYVKSNIKLTSQIPLLYTDFRYDTVANRAQTFALKATSLWTL